MDRGGAGGPESPLTNYPLALGASTVGSLLFMGAAGHGFHRTFAHETQSPLGEASPSSPYDERARSMSIGMIVRRAGARLSQGTRSAFGAPRHGLQCTFRRFTRAVFRAVQAGDERGQRV